MAPVIKRENPVFWVIAGPNGSGKSSLYSSPDVEAFDQSIWIINPDLLTRRIQEVEKLTLSDANLQAVTRVEVWLEASINAHQTVGVETVLSTDKYRRLVLAAKQKQFEFRLIYMMLESPELNVERVRLRAMKGGHDVPAAKIRERWQRSLQQLPWFFEQADWAAIYDNSGDRLRRVGSKSNGIVAIESTAPTAVLNSLALARSSSQP
jgi:predicted ABC-type ATPase